MAKIFYLVAGLFLLAFLQPVLSLKCYQCRKCNDPFKKDGVKTVECPGVCLKTKVASDVGTYKKGDVARDCLPAKAKAECKDEEKDGIKGTICYCDKDLCNGSDVIKVTMTMGVMALVAQLIMNIL